MPASLLFKLCVLQPNLFGFLSHPSRIWLPILCTTIWQRGVSLCFRKDLTIYASIHFSALSYLGDFDSKLWPSMLTIAAIILLIIQQIQPSYALYVANGSPCSSTCNSTTGTYYTNLVCSTDDFESTAKGQLLKSCLECIIDSKYINSSYTDGNTDEYWALCKSAKHWPRPFLILLQSIWNMFNNTA